MIRKILLYSCFFILGITGLQAQTLDSTKNPRIMFGVHLGATTGYGFSYRQWTQSNKFGFQVTSLPLFYSSEYIINMGVTGFYNLHSDAKHRFFAWAGNHAIITSFHSTDIIGAGPGLEISGRILTLSLQIGCATMPSEKVLFPTGEIGLYYNIK